jgi:hypothetical protein
MKKAGMKRRHRCRGRYVGWLCVVCEGRQVAYHYNWFDRERITIVSNEALQIGEVTVTM